MPFTVSASISTLTSTSALASTLGSASTSTTISHELSLSLSARTGLPEQLVELAVSNTDGFSSGDSALHTELQGGEDPSMIDPSMNNYSSLTSMRDVRAITEAREVFTKICSQQDELQECVKFLQECSTEMEYDLSIVRKQAQEADISHRLAENISQHFIEATAALYEENRQLTQALKHAYTIFVEQIG
ncbi:hypothetical protein BU17DRAFT_79695 [Hysterangium stoloniferum]|nr:hypothetical protein BU17DRAFT_79695 [Hysterangium stoloniferum]